MKNKFEEFLQERHGEDYRGCDDNMPDDFNKWICDLDPDQWLNYGEWYGNKLVKEALENHLKTLEKIKI